MKNVIKRIGVIFILVPISTIIFFINAIFIALIIIWGPIYYIVTGNDPLREDLIIDHWFIKFANRYMEKFGPK